MFTECVHAVTSPAAKRRPRRIRSRDCRSGPPVSPSDPNSTPPRQNLRAPPARYPLPRSGNQHHRYLNLRDYVRFQETSHRVNTFAIESTANRTPQKHGTRSDAPEDCQQTPAATRCDRGESATGMLSTISAGSIYENRRRDQVCQMSTSLVTPRSTIYQHRYTRTGNACHTLRGLTPAPTSIPVFKGYK